MIKSFREIDDILFNQVCDCFEKNYDFNSLLECYPYLEYNVLYSILNSTRKYKKELYNCLYQVNIDEGKILLMSDTHYGSIYENINYTYNVFNFAIANGIHIVLHAGDIIEGNVNKRRGYGIINQANYFINTYPSDNSINTYAIFGNHDYLAINQNEIVRDIMCSRNDINILGFKKSYFNWCENIISLQHDIDKYKLNLPSNAECISFKGHAHFYHIKEDKDRKKEKIYIPPMCDDPVYYISNSHLKDKKVQPGFLVAEIDNGNIIITNYSFIYGNIVKENEFVKVLTRK